MSYKIVVDSCGELKPEQKSDNKNNKADKNTDNNVDKPSSSETVTPDDSQNTNAAPETGDSFGKDIMAASFAMIICAMGAAYVLMTRKRRQF